MKYCILVALCFSVAANAQIPTELMNQMRTSLTQCILKTGASPAEIGNLFGPQIPEGKNACLMACIMKKNKAMKADNSIDTSVIKQYLSPLKDSKPTVYETIATVLDTCQASTSTDECEAAKNFKQCMANNTKDLTSI